MRAYLLWPDRPAQLDEDADRPTAALDEQRLTDLGLTDVVAAMARGDRLVAEVSTRLLLDGVTDLEVIAHRQAAMRDAIAHPQVVRTLSDLAEEGIALEREVYSGLVGRPSSLLQRSVHVIERSLGVLRQLHRLADRHTGALRSAALGGLLDLLRRELADDHLDVLAGHLERLRLPAGAPVGVQVGAGGRLIGHTLREPPLRAPTLRRLLPGTRSSAAVELADYDDAGARALAEMREQALTPIAEVVTQASTDIVALLGHLRRELALYLGGINLHDRLTELGLPVCFPTPAPLHDGSLAASDLVDVGLALRTGEPVVGNDFDPGPSPLVLVTGANQGGKSTFLRSVGLAQTMMQAGLFVAARSWRSAVATHVFVHAQRDEDPTLRHGRLDAELAELSRIVDHLRPGDLLLCNESFGATNEREGSLLAHEVLTAFVDAGVRVVFVTHLSDLASTLYREPGGRVHVLRAERVAHGERTFRMRPGVPEPTAYGTDLYAEVFGDVDR